MVIDNQSTDGSREWAAAQPDIEAHLLARNTGHGPGLDYGLRLVNTRFVLVLNSDAHLQRFDWDADLIKLYQSDPRRRLIAIRRRTFSKIKRWCFQCRSCVKSWCMKKRHQTHDASVHAALR
jgi:hypothetical protein